MARPKENRTRTRSVVLTGLILLLAAVAPQPASAAEVPQKPEAAAPAYHYKGREVSAAWIDRQYAYFQNKIAFVDGKFYDIGRALMEPLRHVTFTPPAIGEVRLSSSWATTVLQVVGNDEAIIISGELTFHVRGIDPARQIDGTPFKNMQLIYRGIYQYISVTGAKLTIQDFVIYKPITREQFVAGLDGGLELVQYKEVTVTKKAWKMQGGRRILTNKTETEIVAQPVEGESKP
ncbi:MAG: hypothetical protein IMZ44_00085 [Planctomycetes bacterium]|nr:hypothetical protein [Planctomycetota bacterium]